ncbi:ATP-binding protein [Streptomonospora sp. S1-112]|uniref:ATP-binding protein n=1 Tax=Streptomonospora mangrovi TaxID=2883123 RepID=A0A9X3NQ93_9ACTN|nr:ATP-binding protein [Streptomonospora mangrovi]MDA0567892.1 ATP-binding protein [Streptomonospora mangrovi]
MTTPPVLVTSRVFYAHPASVADARHWMVASLNTAGIAVPEERRAAAVLLCSEATTNAVLHTTDTTWFRVFLHAYPGRIAVQVEDTGGPTRPTLMTAAPTDEHGRGLGLIDHLADEWGPRPTGPGIYYVITWSTQEVYA